MLPQLAPALGRPPVSPGTPGGAPRSGETRARKRFTLSPRLARAGATPSTNENMKPRILQSARLMPALEARLRSEFEAHPLWNEPDPAAFLEARGGEFEILVTNATAGASASMMDALPALKAICSLGVGCDAIDLQAARERGAVVANTPDVLTDCVADIAMGLLIDVARGLSAADRHVRRGKWLEGPFPLTTRVTGKRLGILGLGRIGQAVARRARGFEMQLRYHSRRPVAASRATRCASSVATKTRVPSTATPRLKAPQQAGTWVGSIGRVKRHNRRPLRASSATTPSGASRMRL